MWGGALPASQRGFAGLKQVCGNKMRGAGNNRDISLGSKKSRIHEIDLSVAAWNNWRI